MRAGRAGPGAGLRPLTPPPPPHPLQAELTDHALSVCIANRCADADRRLLRARGSGGKGSGKAAASGAADELQLERRWLHLHQLRLAMSSSPLLAWMQSLSARFMLLHLRIGFECELYHEDELGAVYWNIDGISTLAYRAAQRLNMAALLTREAPELRAVTSETLAVRAAGAWVNPLALEVAGGAAALARFADPAVGLAELSAASLRGKPVLEEEIRRKDASVTQGVAGGDGAAAEGEADASAQGGEGCAADAPGISKKARARAAALASLATPLSDSEKADAATRAAAATAALHERLAAALAAARDTPPWHVQLIEADIYASRGCMSLLAACQLAGLWRGLPDDGSGIAASALPTAGGGGHSVQASSAKVAAGPADAVLPAFSFDAFLPARSSAILYERRFRDFSTFTHPAPPSWAAYRDAFIRQPLADAPISLASLLANADECFTEAHTATSRLIAQLTAVTAVGPDGALPVLTVKSAARPSADASAVAVAAGKGKRGGTAAPPVVPTTRTACIASSSAEVLAAPALLAAVTRLGKAAQANRIAGLALRKNDRAVDALRYYTEAAAVRPALASDAAALPASDATVGTVVPPPPVDAATPSPLIPFGFVAGGGVRLDFSYHPLVGVVKLPSVIKR